MDQATRDPLPSAQRDTRTTSGVPRDLPGGEEERLGLRKASATPGPAPGVGGVWLGDPGGGGTLLRT